MLTVKETYCTQSVSLTDLNSEKSIKQQLCLMLERQIKE